MHAEINIAQLTKQHFRNMAVQPKVSHTKRSIVIVSVVIVLLIVAGVVVEYLSSTNQVHVTEMYMSVWYNSQNSSGYFGQTSRPFGSSFIVGSDSIFTKSLTIKNNATLPGGGTGNVSIDSIDIGPSQFIVQSISPALPYHLDPGASVTLMFSIRSPLQYSGPLTFTVTVS